MEDRWLTVDDIRKYLNVTNETVCKWIDQRGMPGHRVGRRWMFKQDEIDEWVRSGDAAELFILLEQNFLKYDENDNVPSQIHSHLSTWYKELRNLPKNDPALMAKAGYQRKAGQLVISRSCSRVDYAHQSMQFAAIAY